MSFLNGRRVVQCAFFLAAVPAFAQLYSNQYALILKDPPVAERFVGREASSLFHLASSL